jgi:sorbitol-specific phosphotransferase system component IIC
VAFVAVVASLAMGEFLPSRRKPMLLAALSVSILTFGVMAFAQNMIAEHDSVASLFTYLGVTGVVFALIRYVPPFRGRSES